MIQREIKGYKTSRDYAKLWERSKTQSVVCVVDYVDCRDIAQTIAYDQRDTPKDEPDWYIHISARGITYLDAHTFEVFAERCEKYNVEWLVPN